MNAREWYERRLRECARRRDLAAARSARLSYLRLATFLGGIALLVWGLRARSVATASTGVALLAAFAALVVRHARVEDERARHEAARAINARALARLARDWASLPDVAPPADADLDRHPYARDLDVLGRASLAQWLGPPATAAGAAMLARWLLAPAAAGDVVARQSAIRELGELAEWRETLAAEGSLAMLRDEELRRFLEWVESRERPLANVAIWRGVVWTIALATWILIAADLADAIAGPWWALPMIAGLILWFSTARRVHADFDKVSVGEHAVERYVAMFDLVCDREWRTLSLGAVRARVGTGETAAPDRFRALSRLVGFSELRRGAAILHMPIQAVTLWDFHVWFALDAWRRHAGPLVRDWIAALAEIDALSTLAAIHHDYPLWAFPVLDPSLQILTARELGHPLIADDRRVPNDVDVGPFGTLLLVTGSNMSGKSTLLRAVGLNAVLAQAGAPVCATTLSMPPCELQASISVQDSLELGLSQFMAALARLKAIVDAAERRDGERPLLYLLDEILQGTNSAERSVAVRAVVRHLLRARAIGIMTTHDLALANEEPLSSAARLVHFTEQVLPDGSMTFDYRLREGLATSRNALRLMRLIGIEE
jgi:MutS-like protein